MSEEESIREFFVSFERISRLLDERCDALEKKISRNVESKSGLVKKFEKIEMTPEDLGPLADLVSNSHVSDILVNGPDSVYIEIDGKLEKTDIKFQSEEEILRMAEKITSSIGRYLDPERPYIDARLPDGSRVNIIAPPLSLEGTVISIRKFSDTKHTLDNLVQLGSLSSEMAEFLKICARSRVNILIVGGTGTGKTTMLNALAEYIGEDERVVTIEDSAELRIPVPHKVRLETKPYIQGKPKYSEVTMHDLIVNALRMRPDRIIVGEVRGPEAYDMIQAMNTGHEGSMTTVHANNGRDVLLRLENMISMANRSMPSFAVKQRIASAINLVLVLNRLDDGARKLVNIAEITGMETETIMMQTLFEFQEKTRSESGNVSGSFEKSGIMPRLANKTFKYGFKQQMAKIFQYRGT